MRERTGKKFSPEQGLREVQTYLTEIKNLLPNLPESENLIKEINKKAQLIAQKVKEFAEEVKQLQTCAIKSQPPPENSVVIATRDTLTGLPNRLAYEDRIIDAYHRWQRGFGDLSLALVHIDKLAEILKSDRSAGERILQIIANLFKSSIRAVDFLGRYDDQEFIFIFEHTNPAAADMVLEHLRALLEESEFHHHQNINLTASFGFSTLRRDETLESLLSRARIAMNKAKDEGGNQIASS